jgi:heme/copper-type cytochrome/quinol oxidase subunit 3
MRLLFSCPPRWYAAQKAGFTWLLFGHGTVLVAGLVMCAGAAMKRRSPWDICALVMGTAFLGIFFVVGAGIHADSVARAVTC